MTTSNFLRAYIIPGAVFQSVVVGGGYGTGREIVEYFTRFGPAGGILGMLITLICWGVVLGLTYELARMNRTYDYRSFFKQMLGPGWIAFEILYVLMMVLVLAVVASAAGEILKETFGWHYLAGLAGMLGLIALLMFYGRDIIAKVMTAWTAVLYAVFVAYFALAFTRAETDILSIFGEGPIEQGWAVSGFKYAMYNLAIVPAVLFAARGIETRNDAFKSGFFSALVCIVPALLFHVTFSGAYPGILTEDIPLYEMIDRIGAGFLLISYVIVLFGTFVETGAGYIQGVNERIDGTLAEHHRAGLKQWHRIALGIGGMLVSAGLATLGIVTLIAEGYGLISWGFFAVYVLPVVTLGAYRVFKR